jgi:hypothetical protein
MKYCIPTHTNHQHTLTIHTIQYLEARKRLLEKRGGVLTLTYGEVVDWLEPFVCKLEE